MEDSIANYGSTACVPDWYRDFLKLNSHTNHPFITLLETQGMNPGVLWPGLWGLD